MLRQKWILMLLFAPFLETEYLWSLPGIHPLFTVAKIGALCIITALLLMRGRISKFLILLCLFEGERLAVTLLRGGDLRACLMDAACVIGVCALGELAVCESPDALLQGLLWLLGGMTAVNLLTLLLYESGMAYGESRWFLGYDNMFITYLLPAMTVALLWTYRRGTRMTAGALVLLVVVSLSVVRIWSAASLVAVGMLWFYLLFLHGRRPIRPFSIDVYLLVTAGLNLTIVLLRRYRFLEQLVVDLLGKDMTFTYRVDIWDAAIDRILRAPLLGQGVLSAAEMSAVLMGGEHAHNFLLQITFQGGIVSAVLFCCLLAAAVKPLYLHRNAPMAKLLSWTIFIIATLFLVEAYPVMPLFYLLFLFGYHVERLGGLSR